MRILLPLVVIFLIINWVSLNSYFSQDDFYHLRQVMDKSFLDIHAFLKPTFSPEQTFYRPVSREIFGILAFIIFKLNPLPYHLINLSLILINGFFLYKISLKKLGKTVAAITVLFYIISPVHSIELYYLSSVQTLLATTFILLSFLNLERYIKLRQKSYWILSVIFALFSVFSHESLVIGVLMLIIFSFMVYREKLGIRNFVADIAPFAILVVLRVILQLSVNFPRQEEYIPSFAPVNIANGFVWFTLWILGLPEMLKDFITLRFQINANLFKFYSGYLTVAFPAILIMVISAGYAIFNLGKNIRTPMVLFICYLLAILPFVFFPNHRFIYYLTFPLIFFSLFMGCILSNLLKRDLLGRTIVAMFFFAYLSLAVKDIGINRDTHWAAKRQVAAKFLIREVSRSYPVVDKGQIFYFIDDPYYPEISREWGTSSLQAFYILSGSDALKLFYNDKDIRVYFQGKGGLPSGISKTKVKQMIAKFPY